MSIISSLLDTDLSNLLTQQYIFHSFLKVPVSYEIFCEDKNINISKYSHKIKKEIESLLAMTFDEKDIAYLKSLGYFKDDYLDYLKTFSFSDITFHITSTRDSYKIEVKGSWDKLILCKAIQNIISQVFYQETYLFKPNVEKLITAKNYLEIFTNQISKDFLQQLRFFDGGTKSRYNAHWQYNVLKVLKDRLSPQFIGTTNVEMAKAIDCRLIGYFDNDYLASQQILGPDKNPIENALADWQTEYWDSFSIASVDSCGISEFLKEFNSFNANEFAGIRLEAGYYANSIPEILNKYKEYKINAKNKLLIINTDKAKLSTVNYLQRTYHKQINVLFEMGGNLMCNMDIPNLNMRAELATVRGLSIYRNSDEASLVYCQDKKIEEGLKNGLANV